MPFSSILRWFKASISKEKLESLDITFYLDEIEAIVYSFLEKNLDKAFTITDMFQAMVHEGRFAINFSEASINNDHSIHPFYHLVRKKVEAMVNEGNISGRYSQGKFYYTVWFLL